MRTAVPNRSNFIVGLSINENSPVDRIQSKSFIVKDDNDVILDIVEKDIVSNVICVGVYAANARQFADAYAEIRQSDVIQRVGELYVSHVMSYLMLQKKILFTILKLMTLWTGAPWKTGSRNVRKHKTYLIDIDGVILRNYGKYGEKNWGNTFEPIMENVRVVKRLSDEGHEIVLHDFSHRRVPGEVSAVSRGAGNSLQDNSLRLFSWQADRHQRFCAQQSVSIMRGRGDQAKRSARHYLRERPGGTR